MSVPANGTINATVPLGSVVVFEAFNNAGDPVPVTFALGQAQLAAGVLTSKVLFRDKTLMRFMSPAANQGWFQAVHLGVVSIAVQPTSSASSGGTIVVTVENPLKLGNSGNFLDAAIYDMAHETGVPPQFIKGHAAKESFPKFNGLSYRYEPIGQPYVGDLSGVSTLPTNLRVVSPFSSYRLATQEDAANDALPKGALLNDADRDARHNYLIGCDANGAGGTPIGPGERAVNPTAWEIVRCSDTQLKLNWAKVAKDSAPEL